MAHIQSYKIGPQSELSQKILNEISRAKVCLLNPEAKSEYDAQLRAEVDRQTLAPPVETSAFDDSTFDDSTAPFDDSLALAIEPAGLGGLETAGLDDFDSASKKRPDWHRQSLRLPKTRQRRRAAPIAVTLACLLLILAGIAFTFVGDGPASDEPLEVEEPLEMVDHAVATSADIPRMDVPATLDSPRASASRRASAMRSPANGPAAANTDTRHPIPTQQQLRQAQQQLRQARDKLQIEGKISPNQVLDAAIAENHPWMRYVLLQLAIELCGQADSGHWAEARRIALTAADMLVREYQVSGDFHNQVESQFRNPPRVPSAGGNLEQPK